MLTATVLPAFPELGVKVSVARGMTCRLEQLTLEKRVPLDVVPLNATA
jgi:hypothetical protein